MSIDFNALTSKLEHTTASGYGTTTWTILVWAWADGQGEGSFGRILCLSETDENTSFYHQNAANTLVLYKVWSGTDGQWTFPATDGQWNAIALSYDGSLTTNNPVARVNFAPVTVTQVAGDPGGTVTAPVTGYCIGNNTGQTRTWDGALQHLQFFNVILTTDEMDAALRYPGSIRRGIVSHWRMNHAGDIVDLVNTAFQPTATALGTRDGAPCRMAWPSRPRGWRGGFTAGAGAQTIGCTGIASAEAFGTLKANRTITASGVATAQAFGTDMLRLSIAPSAIASAEALGTAKLNRNLLPSGIGSAEGLGTAKLNRTILPSGIGSLETIGAHLVSVAGGVQTILPAGIASLETFGTGKLNFILKPSATGSAETVPGPRMIHTVAPSAIASAEGFGAGKLNLLLSVLGLASAEAVGSHTVTGGTPGAAIGDVLRVSAETFAGAGGSSESFAGAGGSGESFVG